MKRLSIAVCLIAVLGMAGNAFALAHTWGGGSESWNTLSSWWMDLWGTNATAPATELPSFTYYVNFGGDRAPGSSYNGVTMSGTLPTNASTIGDGVDAKGKGVTLAGRNSPQNMTMTIEAGGTLTTEQPLRVGIDWYKGNVGGSYINSPSDSDHTITTAGTVNVGTYLQIGASTGSSNQASNSIGRMLITGGVVKVNQDADGVQFQTGDRTPYIEISNDGELWWSGSHTSTVNGWLSTGTNNIRGDGLTIVEEDGWTKVLIPEPATVAILGLGSLVLLRKRR